jgi:hypothetical protein
MPNAAWSNVYDVEADSQHPTRPHQTGQYSAHFLKSIMKSE